MKKHRVRRYRTLGGSAALAGLLVAGLGLSAPGFAQEAGSNAAPTGKTIIRIVGKDGKETTLEAKELTRFAADCPDIVNVQERIAAGGAGKSEAPQVLICAKSGKAPSPEMRERLSAALERANAQGGPLSNLTPERRAQARAAFQRELDRMRTEEKK